MDFSYVFIDGTYTVQFTTESVVGVHGAITDYAWDFGDTFTSIERDPIHSFNRPLITLDVSLTVTYADLFSESVTHTLDFVGSSFIECAFQTEVESLPACEYETPYSYQLLNPYATGTEIEIITNPPVAPVLSVDSVGTSSVSLSWTQP